MDEEWEDIVWDQMQKIVEQEKKPAVDKIRNGVFERSSKIVFTSRLGDQEIKS